MSRLLTSTALALALGLGWAGMSGAQTAGDARGGEAMARGGQVTTQEQQPGAMDAQRPQVGAQTGAAAAPGEQWFEAMSADDLIGRNVVNQQGENIGNIEDIVLDPEGEVMHAVISVGGFLGIGAQDVAVPFDELQLGADDVILMSDATQDQLRDRPAFAEDQYRRVEERDRPLGEQARLRDDARPGAAAGAAATADRPATADQPAATADRPATADQPAATADRPATQPGMQAGVGEQWYGNLSADELIGRNVVNQQGENVGNIEDIVLDPDGEAIHAVISVGGFLGIGARDVAVPFDELQMGPDDVILMSDATQDELRARPEYDQERFQPVDRNGRLGERTQN